MADTMFIDGTTTVVASWLNDVNDATYTTVPAHTSTLASGVVLKDSSTGGAQIPSGTTAQRPGAPVGTLLRYNTTISNWEGYNGSVWGLLASGFASSGPNNDITSLGGLTTPVSLVALRSYLTGLTLSTAGASTTMSIAAGVAMDSTNTYLMQLSAISKITSSWAVGSGNGGIDTGAIANATWYYFYLIRRPDTGVVDVIFSTSSSAPTLPANYTQYRYIGAGLTNGSAQWVKFYQDGDRFTWDSSVMDVNATSSGTVAVLRTLTVPRKKVVALVHVIVAASASGESVYFSDPATTDIAPSLSAAPGVHVSANNGVFAAGQIQMRTDTSARIRSRQITGGAADALRIFTDGWIDTRGKDA